MVGAYYYLRIVKIMYFDEPDGAFVPMAGRAAAGHVGLPALFMLFYVLSADPLGQWREAAAKSFF